MSSKFERAPLKRDPVIQFSVSKQQRAQIHQMVRKWNWEQGKATRADVLRRIVLERCKAYLTEQEQAQSAQGVEERSYYVRVNPYEDADRFWSSAKRLAEKDSHFRGPYEQVLRTDSPVKVPESWLALARRCPGFGAGPLLVNRKVTAKRAAMASPCYLQVPEPIFRIVTFVRQATGRSTAGYVRHCITHAIEGKTKLPVPECNERPVRVIGKPRQLTVILPEETMHRWTQATRHFPIRRHRAMIACLCQAIANESVVSTEQKRLLRGYISHLVNSKQNEGHGKNHSFVVPPEIVRVIRAQWISPRRSVSSFVRHALSPELGTSGYPRIPKAVTAPLPLPATARIHARISENTFGPWSQAVTRFGLAPRRLAVAYACEAVLKECELSKGERALVSGYLSHLITELCSSKVKTGTAPILKGTVQKALPRLDKVAHCVA